jgi:hypothetical protein
VCLNVSLDGRTARRGPRTPTIPSRQQTGAGSVFGGCQVESPDPDREAKLDRIGEVLHRFPDRVFVFDEFSRSATTPCGGVNRTHKGCRKHAGRTEVDPRRTAAGADCPSASQPSSNGSRSSLNHYDCNALRGKCGAVTAIADGLAPLPFPLQALDDRQRQTPSRTVWHPDTPARHTRVRALRIPAGASHRLHIAFPRRR